MSKLVAEQDLATWLIRTIDILGNLIKATCLDRSSVCLSVCPCARLAVRLFLSVQPVYGKMSRT